MFLRIMLRERLSAVTDSVITKGFYLKKAEEVILNVTSIPKGRKEEPKE